MIKLWQRDWVSAMPAKKETVKRKTLGVKGVKTKKTAETGPSTVSHDSQFTIHGIVNGSRTPSRILEEQIQEAVEGGARQLRVIADGQHGIGDASGPGESP